MAALKPSFGKVYLIGAGPGDPDMLTLKAAKAIASATVLMVDDLVNPEILLHASSNARVIHVGKRGGCASTSQSFIEKLMVSEAKAGETVARIKGGDPYIFGRGGEELSTLQMAGIACEVINGITSGLAAATLAGVPLTHRDYTQGVIFVTGHSKSTVDPVNWGALAASGMTLVIYMGIGQATHIQNALLQSGLSKTTPAVIVQAAGTKDHVQHFTTLAGLATTIASKALKSPSIMVIGKVVECGLNQLDYLTTRINTVQAA